VATLTFYRVCDVVGQNVGDDRQPKYENPPRTAVYDKSMINIGPYGHPATQGDTC
jgi:hypothetical protein